ncbi:MAG: hypothetical protein CM15mP103_12660 [Gammaproteobacteria bacterium]|nr:MAG: hypothetical protein CM15mP103_12660 [Gammaproteobacteria bacterium]
MLWTQPQELSVGTHPASLIARASHRFQSVIKACPPRLPAQINWYSQGTLDGNLKAYDSVSGEIIWSFDTYGEFESVSGEMALGGSIESDGPVLIRGMSS